MSGRKPQTAVHTCPPRANTRHTHVVVSRPLKRGPCTASGPGFRSGTPSGGRAALLAGTRQVVTTSPGPHACGSPLGLHGATRTPDLLACAQQGSAECTLRAAEAPGRSRARGAARTWHVEGGPQTPWARGAGKSEGRSEGLLRKHLAREPPETRAAWMCIFGLLCTAPKGKPLYCFASKGDIEDSTRLWGSGVQELNWRLQPSEDSYVRRGGGCQGGGGPGDPGPAQGGRSSLSHFPLHPLR